MDINHRKGAVTFNNEDIESDGLCDHLMNLADSLNKARDMVYSQVKKQSKLGENLYGLADIVEKEHRRLLARKSIIEKRKEEHERQMLEREREEESRRKKQQKTTEEAEQRRLAAEYTRREEQRIRREIEERELQEAQALLLQAEKGPKKKGKRAALEGDKVTKQALLEMALSEQLKERQEMEKKLQRLAKTMDYMERAKREEEAPLIEHAFHQHFVEEQIIHEHEQLREIELSKQHHAGDLQEKNRLARMLDNKVTFQKRIEDRRDAEYKRLRKEREDRYNQQISMRKLDREIKRKLLFYIKSEEERLTKLREEEETQKLEEVERRKREEAERKTKLDEIAEKQRQRERELEEKERLRKDALIGRNNEPLPRPADSVVTLRTADPVAATAAAAPTTKYVPRFRREKAEDAAADTPPEQERWGRHDDRPSQPSDKWQSDDRDRRSSFGGSKLPSSNSSWSASRTRG